MFLVSSLRCKLQKKLSRVTAPLLFVVAAVSVLVIVSVVAVVCANYFFCVVPVVGVLLSVL